MSTCGGKREEKNKVINGKGIHKTKAVMSTVAKISSKKHKAGTVQEKRHRAGHGGQNSGFLTCRTLGISPATEKDSHTKQINKLKLTLTC